MAKKTLRAYEPATIEIEPAVTDESGKVLRPAEMIDVRVKRLTITESALFDRLFWRAVTEEAERLVLVRRPGEEQARVHEAAIGAARLAELRAGLVTLSPADAVVRLTSLLDELVPTDQFVVPDEEIRRRRLIEMTEAERARYDRLRKEDAEAYGEFLSEALQHFITVPAGQIEYIDADEQAVDVVNGEQLARCYGARPSILRQIAMAIRAVNELTEAEKNVWRSRAGSSSGSETRDLTATGASSAPTAGSVDPSAGAMTEAATPTAVSGSGLTAN